MRPKQITSVVTMLATICILVFLNYWYYTNHISPLVNEPMFSEDDLNRQFENDLSAFADKLGVNNQEALADAQALVAGATTPLEEGRAKLALGLAQLRLDVQAAVITFKEVSIDKRFHPFTRERAVWYIIATYLYSQDDELARAHIFTGPIWEEFLPNINGTSDSTTPSELAQARRNALLFANNLYETPQVVSQLAVIAAEDILHTELSEAKRNELAANVFAQLNQASELLDRTDAEDARLYAGTQYVVAASTLDNQALALDLLQHADTGVTPEQVEIAYQEALSATTNRRLTTTHEYHARYHYADWLLRQDATANKTKIIEILDPMSELNANTDFAQSFNRRLVNKEEALADNGQPGQVNNIIRLANISSSFKTLLLATGIRDEQLLLQ